MKPLWLIWSLRRRLRVTCCIGYLVLAACQPSGSDGSNVSPIVADSAGIRMVQHNGAPSGDSVRLSIVWEHGHDLGDYEFQTVYVGDVQPDGSAIVSDVANQEVVWISPEGEDSRLLAATGQGPGEVMGPGPVIVVAQDTAWVGDLRSGATMRFDNGELARTINPLVTGGMMFFGVDAGGDLLFTTSSYSSRFDEPWLDGYVAHLELASSEFDTVSSYPMASRTPETNRNPFAPQGLVSRAGDGFVQARTDLPELIWRNSSGQITQIARWRPQLRYPSDSSWDEFTAYQSDMLRRLNNRRSEEQLRSLVTQQLSTYSLDRSVPLPLFGRAVGGADGAVWLPEFLPSGARPRNYLVVSSDGTSLGQARFPEPFAVISANDTFVLGVVEDELGVQAVAVYRHGETQ